MNEKTLEQLFRKYYSLLCNYAYKYVADKNVAEDIVQTFFITIWEKKHLSIDHEIFLPYAYRSIKNGCFNYLKSETIKEDFFSVLLNEWQERLDQEQDEYIYKNNVRQAFLKLPEKCRKIFLLKCVSGLRYKEIAEMTGVSVNTVKYHIGEAFRIMRRELKDIMLFF